MAKNEFLPFGTAANANVLPNADYQALPARASGFSSGVAKSEQLNTVWRQSSTMAAAVGQFIADKTGQDVLDNGNVPALANQLNGAISFFAATGLLDDNGYISIPVNISGVVKNLLIQWGAAYTGVAAGNPADISYPKPFTDKVLSVILTRTSNTVSGTINSIVVSPKDKTAFTVRASEDNASFYWLAIGK
ncbi:hypothetical protein D3C73_597080 [compost metagenome]